MPMTRCPTIGSAPRMIAVTVCAGCAASAYPSRPENQGGEVWVNTHDIVAMRDAVPVKVSEHETLAGTILTMRRRVLGRFTLRVREPVGTVLMLIQGVRHATNAQGED